MLLLAINSLSFIPTTLNQATPFYIYSKSVNASFSREHEDVFYRGRLTGKQT